MFNCSRKCKDLFEIFNLFMIQIHVRALIFCIQMTRRAELNSLAVGSKSNTGSVAIGVPPRPRRWVILGVSIDNLS